MRAGLRDLSEAGGWSERNRGVGQDATQLHSSHPWRNARFVSRIEQLDLAYGRRRRMTSLLCVATASADQVLAFT